MSWRIIGPAIAAAMLLSWEMLRTRIKRQAAEAERAAARLADIEASVAALADEDLLDLADIFAGGAPTPLREMAAAEMLKRNLSL